MIKGQQREGTCQHDPFSSQVHLSILPILPSSDVLGTKALEFLCPQDADQICNSSLSVVLGYQHKIFTAALGLCSLLLSFWSFSSQALKEQAPFVFCQCTLSKCDPFTFTRQFSWACSSRLKISLAFSTMLKSHMLF